MIQDDSEEFESWQSYQNFALQIRLRNRFIWNEDIRKFLKTVVKTIRQRDRTLGKGCVLFRAQLGVEWRWQDYDDEKHLDVFGLPASRMKPLTGRAKEGRANPAGIPMLYVATSIETAISEVRPWVGSEVSLATLKLLRPLKLLDLSLGHAGHPLDGPVWDHVVNNAPLAEDDKRTAVWKAIDRAFSTPVTATEDEANYAPTQVLAELFKSQGYDGIAYKSQFGEEKGFNLAIFDPTAADVVSCAPYIVRKINVSAEQIGNEWYVKK